jgi:membrane protease YdiL (CAAX protease family)
MPIIKVLLFAIFFIICALPFLLIAQFQFVSQLIIHSNTLAVDIVSEIITVVMVISALLMVLQVFKYYDFKAIFIVKRNIFSGFAKGSLIGFTLLCLCSLIAFLTGNVSFVFGKISILIFIGYIFFYILVAIFEEFLFRSFPLLVFSERYHLITGILLTSLLFGLAHFWNPGFTWLAMLNITLAGVLFSILILAKRNIYWAVGFHFGWNFTQGTLLGYKVSGTDGPGVLNAKPLGSTYLSGGNFGIESSIYCTFAMLILIVFLLARYKIEPVVVIDKEEIQEETEIA